MKKILFIMTALVSLNSVAMAGNVSQNIPVTGTVNSSCVFEGDAVPLTFTYAAATGIVNQTGGTTGTLHCNFGSIQYTDHPPVITINKPETLLRTDGSARLGVNLVVNEEEASAGGPGSQYYGSDSRTFTVVASASPNQWTVPNADYAGTITVNVDF